MHLALVNPAVDQATSADIRAVLDAMGTRLETLTMQQPGDVAQVLTRLAQGPVELLVVIGGDGTLGNLLTHAGRAGVVDDLPPILTIPLGRLHTVASVLTGKDKPALTLKRILFAWGKGVRRIRRVPVIRAQVGDHAPKFCLTASLGAPARLHRDIRGQKLGGRVGLTGLLAKVAMQPLEPERFEAIVGPFVSEPEPLALPAFTAGVVSALPSFFGMVHPFPGVDGLATQHLHAVFSELGPMATQASLPGLLLGRVGLPHVWHGKLTTLGWENGAEPDVVVLDGEDTPVPPGARVHLSLAARVRMVVWRDLPLPAPDER